MDNHDYYCRYNNIYHLYNTVSIPDRRWFKYEKGKKKGNLPLNKVLYDLAVAYPHDDFPSTCISQEDFDLIQLRLPEFITNKLANDDNKILSELEQRYSVFIDLITI